MAKWTRATPAFPKIVGTAVWNPDAGIDAFRRDIDPNGYMETSTWYVEQDRLHMPGWGAPDSGYGAGETVTVTVTMS